MLIVGLGNPGQQYHNTRHNVGFMVIDELLKRHSHTQIKKTDFQGELFKVNSHYLLKPTTFMNLSGKSIAAVKKFYKIEDVVVIHDDLDLPFGALRFKRGGGHGGHNGLKSTDESISKEYMRVRMGIAKPTDNTKIVDWVLKEFSETEKPYLSKWIDSTCNAVEKILTQNFDDVSSQCSVKKITIAI
ncbi:MAG: aminoacyl-tRNA hydrolase [Campylobacterota bacterium]|nr:aminoacyl-tRNA hydrolase [Campylobacterota bacterium]